MTSRQERRRIQRNENGVGLKNYAFIADPVPTDLKVSIESPRPRIQDNIQTIDIIIQRICQASVRRFNWIELQIYEKLAFYPPQILQEILYGGIYTNRVFHPDALKMTEGQCNQNSRLLVSEYPDRFQRYVGVAAKKGNRAHRSCSFAIDDTIIEEETLVGKTPKGFEVLFWAVHSWVRDLKRDRFVETTGSTVADVYLGTPVPKLLQEKALMEYDYSGVKWPESEIDVERGDEIVQIRETMIA